MEDISFFSKGVYLSIPSRKNAKVILAVGNKETAKNSFKIYNPFSAKAKIFKSLMQFITVNFNKLSMSFFRVELKENSEFIHFLNNKFQKSFKSSVYNATLKDKVVIQLQFEGKVFGYVKFPMNDLGLKNISNEIRAIELLSEKGILKLHMTSMIFKGTPFFILPELKGNISNLGDSEIIKLIEPYKKNIVLKLVEQARVKEIKTFFVQRNMIDELKILEMVVKSSNESYHEAYEHGDFAPWNIVNTNDGLAAFDFEYFTEKGLEYFDLIKYHFQVGRLLKGKNHQELFNYISQKIDVIEIKQLVSLFLFKEIMTGIQQQKTSDFEYQMLKFINE